MITLYLNKLLYDYLIEDYKLAQEKYKEMLLNSQHFVPESEKDIDTKKFN